MSSNRFLYVDLLVPSFQQNWTCFVIANKKKKENKTKKHLFCLLSLFMHLLEDITGKKNTDRKKEMIKKKSINRRTSALTVEEKA